MLLPSAATRAVRLNLRWSRHGARCGIEHPFPLAGFLVESCLAREGAVKQFAEAETRCPHWAAEQ